MLPESGSPVADDRRSVLGGASGAWDWDIREGVLRGDVRFAELYGLEPERLRDGVATETFFGAIDALDRMRVRIAVAGILNGAEVFSREFRLPDCDGGVRWVLARGGLSLDADDQPSHFTGVLTDITEQKKVEQQLRVAQIAGGIGSFEHISGFGTATVSEQFCRLLGLYPADSLPVRTINAVVAPGEPPIVLDVDATPEQQSAYAEFRIRRADTGETRWLARRGEVTSDGGMLGRRFVGVVYDVTAAKNAEERLQDLARTLEDRVEARTQERDRIWGLSQDLFAVVAEGRLQSINPAWSRIFDRDQSELVGARLKTLVHPDDASRLTVAFAGVAVDGVLPDFSARVGHRDGSWRWIDWTGAVQDGQTFLTGRDVSHRRMLEDQLRQSQKMEAVGQLTGGLAHDFNNMLTGIIGSLDIIRRRIAEGRAAETTRFMDAASASAERAAALTHRLLAFSRQQTLDTQAVDVNLLVSSMEDLLTRTLGERTPLRVSLESGLWPVWSDVNQLESALLNLAINARDAMPGGGVLSIETRNETISDAEASPKRPAGDYVRISVGDTGSGMPPEIIEKVFEPFFTTKPIGQGTGLGLSMIYGFVGQTGGDVTIESTPGQGTTISLHLVRAADAVRTDSELEPVRAPLGRGQHILVVEDDPTVRLLVANVLAELGYESLEAADAEEALAILQDAPFDMLITDVGLPGLNGRQLADRAREKLPDLRVLFMTGYSDEAWDRNAFAGAHTALITKPFALDTLARRIQEILG